MPSSQEITGSIAPENNASIERRPARFEIKNRHRPRAQLACYNISVKNKIGHNCEGFHGEHEKDLTGRNYRYREVKWLKWIPTPEAREGARRQTYSVRSQVEIFRPIFICGGFKILQRWK